MKIDKLTCYGYNSKTEEIETFISGCILYKEEHPMISISTKNVKLIAEALFEKLNRNYCISDIDLSPFVNDGGVKIVVQLEPLDNWSTEGRYSKDWLYRHLKDAIDILGKPTNIVESDAKYYAVWTRNMVVWF